MFVKKFCLTLIAALLLILTFGQNGIISARAEGEKVYIGGMPAGFVLDTRGATVLGTVDVFIKDAFASPAKDAGINAGDIILTLNDIEINNAKDIEKVLIKCGGEKLEITFLRRGAQVKGEIIPAKEQSSGQFKLGLLIKDGLSGIGTVTYFKESDMRFGALGHAVYDSDSGDILNIRSGSVFKCSIISITRGERGKTGELGGIFLRDKVFAVADKNLNCGVFGKADNIIINEKAKGLYDIGGKNTVKMGKAVIYTTIEGVTPEEYNISIVKVDKNAKDNKNLVIKIDDKRLLEATGGIVQGMSGSPILQDGKLVGAITHE